MLTLVYTGALTALMIGLEGILVDPCTCMCVYVYVYVHVYVYTDVCAYAYIYVHEFCLCMYISLYSIYTLVYLINTHIHRTGQSMFPRIDCVSGASSGSTRVIGLGRPYSSATPYPYFESDIIGSLVRGGGERGSD